MYSLNRYNVSSDGEIWDTVKNQKVKQFKSNKYLQCLLFDDDGKRHVLGVHTVVARFCCDDWFDGCVVHHVDGDTHNNSADNLQCISRSEHSRHHADASSMIDYIKKNGSWNKGKAWSEESKRKMSESAKRRHENGNDVFHGNQYVDANYNRII